MVNAIKEKKGLVSRMSMGPQKASQRDYVCSGSWSSTCENPDRKGEVGTFQKLKGGSRGWSAVLGSRECW